MRRVVRDARWGNKSNRPLLEPDGCGWYEVVRAGRVLITVGFAGDSSIQIKRYVIQTPIGWKTDGATIPRIALMFIPKARADYAGAIHDWLYGAADDSAPALTRKEADVIFRQLLLKEEFKPRNPKAGFFVRACVRLGAWLYYHAGVPMSYWILRLLSRSYFTRAKECCFVRAAARNDDTLDEILRVEQEIWQAENVKK